MIVASVVDPDPHGSHHVWKLDPYPDPDPHQTENLDPDLHRSEKQDPDRDPHQSENVKGKTAMEDHPRAVEAHKNALNAHARALEALEPLKVRICIKVICRIRIRIRIIVNKSRIRICIIVKSTLGSRSASE
jgi:hypothetical protein